MTSQKYISVGKITALISFIIGIIIFGIYYFTSDEHLLFLGYVFVIIAGIFNLIILLAILLRSQSDKAHRKMLLKTSGLMLLNIPVMIVCVWVATIVLANMRITFTNGTQNRLTNIRIFGCETENIAELEPNESKTVWVGITGDCSISIEYVEEGERKSEIVASYVTNGMGQKMKHNIDGRDKDIF